MSSSRYGVLTIWSVLVPGLPQWRRGQSTRGAILAGWYASSMTVGLPTFGSPVGWLALGFATLVHVASVADAMNLAAFPRLAVGSTARWTAAGLLIALGFYLPLLLVGAGTGWPTLLARSPRHLYLIQRGAYRTSAPRPGDRVWIDAHGDVEAGPATVIAGPDDFVRRLGDAYQRPGREPWHDPDAPRGPAIELEFRVPRGQLLVAFDRDRPNDDPADRAPCLVAVAQVRGRIGLESSRPTRPIPDADPSRTRTQPAEPTAPPTGSIG